MFRESKYIQILKWAYKKKDTGFTWDELKEKFSLDNLEEKWIKKKFLTASNNDRKFFEHYYNDDSVEPNLHYYSLNEKGISAALHYLNENQNKYLSTIAIVISILALFIAIYTALLTKKAVELSAEPVLSISPSNEIVEISYPVSILYGFVPAPENLTQLTLTNNSLSKIEDVSIQMTLWQYYVDVNSKHLTVCPLGYVRNVNNSEFYVSTTSLNTSNDHEPTVNSFDLAKNETHDFSFNYGEISRAYLEPKDSKVLLKVDVRYVKSSSQLDYNYTKLYVVSLFGEQIIDVNKAPDYALSLNDLKNNKVIGGFARPAFVYPFREEEFLNYFSEVPNDLDFFSVCPEFRLEKIDRMISY